MNPFTFAHNTFLSKKEPISLIHFITNKCNARCKHCFIDFGNPDFFKNELTIEEIEKLVKSLGKNLFNVNLTGGEPFLRKDIFEIVSLYLKYSTIESIFISTNGMFTEKIKNFVDRFLLENKKGIIKFSISVDNFEREHDLNRRSKGLFKNALKTYKVLLSYNSSKILPNIGITVTHHNYRNVFNLYFYLKKQGIKSITATIMREEGVVKKILSEDKKEILKAYNELTKLIIKDQINGSMTGFGRSLQGLLMNSKNILINKIIRETYLTPKFISKCPAGSLFGVIYPNGDVYPCEILPKKIGNLRKYNMNFIKLWSSSMANNTKKFIWKTKCNCTYECAWTINVISNPQFFPGLINNCLLRSK